MQRSSGLQLAARGTASVIPTNPTHKHQWYINLETYKDCNFIERVWCRLKDYRRIATRSDKLPVISRLQLHLWQSLFGGLIESRSRA